MLAYPEAAPVLLEREEVRTIPFGRYPYRLFYRIVGDTIEVLHIHHAARQTWTGQ